MNLNAPNTKEYNEGNTIWPNGLELTGMQSVRATFKLDEACVRAISIVSHQLGIKQKSLFDHLARDVDALSAIAQKNPQPTYKDRKRIQKTYVISKRSLASLEMAAKTHHASRNTLVEYSVRQLLPIIVEERKKHRKRKVLLSRLSRHLDTGQRILAEIESDLGREDPLYDRLQPVMSAYGNIYTDLDAFISKTDKIEGFNPQRIATLFPSD